MFARASRVGRWLARTHGHGPARLNAGDSVRKKSNDAWAPEPSGHWSLLR